MNLKFRNSKQFHNWIGEKLPMLRGEEGISYWNTGIFSEYNLPFQYLGTQFGTRDFQIDTVPSETRSEIRQGNTHYTRRSPISNNFYNIESAEQKYASWLNMVHSMPDRLSAFEGSPTLMMCLNEVRGGMRGSQDSTAPRKDRQETVLFRTMAEYNTIYLVERGWPTGGLDQGYWSLVYFPQLEPGRYYEYVIWTDKVSNNPIESTQSDHRYQPWLDFPFEAPHVRYRFKTERIYRLRPDAEGFEMIQDGLLTLNYPAGGL
jgi:hypothetical protein